MVDSRSELNETYNSVVSKYYDAVYGASPELEASRAFYLDLAQRTNGAVLELGCGTGRVLLELLRRQIPCVGLDSSRAMLDVLRSKARPTTPDLVCSQMQHFDLSPKQFSLVCAPFRGFQHLYDLADQRGCLRSVFAHLESAGSFAFDVAAPFEEMAAPLEEEERMDSELFVEGARVVRYVKKQRDPARRLTVLTMRFETSDGVGPPRSEAEVINMRWFEPEELHRRLDEAGFVDISVSGDFRGRPVDGSSSALVIVARKP